MSCLKEICVMYLLKSLVLSSSLLCQYLILLETAGVQILKQPQEFYAFLCVSDGNMNDQELNEPQNRVALLKGNCGRASVIINPKTPGRPV